MSWIFAGRQYLDRREEQGSQEEEELEEKLGEKRTSCRYEGQHGVRAKSSLKSEARSPVL